MTLAWSTNCCIHIKVLVTAMINLTTSDVLLLVIWHGQTAFFLLAPFGCMGAFPMHSKLH